MNEITTPEWIKRRKAADAKGESATQKTTILSLRIKSEGPEFWRQLILELTINVNALPEIGARGKVSAFGDSPKKQQSCRVDVGQKGSVRGATYTDLFYTPGNPNIEYRTLEGDRLDFDFCILTDGKLGVVSDDDELTQLGSKELAEMLTEQCVKRLLRGEDF